MYRAACLFLFASSVVFAQTPSPKPASHAAPSSVVQVVYAIDGSTLTTYNVDPQTLQAAAIGTTTILNSNTPQLITSPNGQFLYYVASPASSTYIKELYVYDTDASGVPRRLVQKLSDNALFGMAMHPSGRFLYTIDMGTFNGRTVPYRILRSLIDENNGKISRNVLEATYHLDAGTSSCSLALLGFNNSGTTMYDAVFCSYPHGTSAATYYERTVDLQTGALGTDQQILTWNFYAGSGSETVQFVNNLMFDFTMTEFSPDSIDVYRVKPNVSKPIVNCTSSMWVTCGNLSWHSLAHPSGKYVFVYDTSNITEIGKVEYSAKQIVQTSSIPYLVWHFSPDGTIVYAVTDVGTTSNIEIYGFSVSSGQVTQGGTISLPSYLDSWFVTERF